MQARRTEEDGRMKTKCCDWRCFRAVFLDNHFDVVNERPKCAQRVFLGGTIIVTLGLIGFGIYVLVIAGKCYSNCKIHAWIPTYLVLGALAEMAHLPSHYAWITNRDPEDLSFSAFDIYRLFSWSLLLSVSIFGAIVVYPHVVDFQDTWHHKRTDQCPCFYWSFWWLTGTWFSLMFNFSSNWLMYILTPWMDRLMEERERRHYEKWYDEERQYHEAYQRQSRSEVPNQKVPPLPSVRHEQNEKAPLTKSNVKKEQDVRNPK